MVGEMESPHVAPAVSGSCPPRLRSSSKEQKPKLSSRKTLLETPRCLSTAGGLQRHLPS